ncbi:leucine-rich repeat domain-containing protein [Oceanispirochaeta sp.]|jgi:Leucine-rich repeat (LRR) protein|uniref:leucine-rich repeat domain-containing protein n=1 Tax=Oceanispirochaeta sp. TaxID=2035350 RepID=UPI002636388D|nr:leucine-rich repeat domain-containing protein [Oceanispirochaeta sp.]MDA3958776.1 leucine-rich repeat domain-containing protein [Oceanispirochaeta sp.]
MTSGSPLLAAESFRQVLSQGPYDKIKKLLEIVGRDSPQLINLLIRDSCLHSSGHVELPAFFGKVEDITAYSLYSFWTMVSLMEVKPLWFYHLESFHQDGAPRDEDFRFPPGLIHCPVLKSLTIRNAGLVELPIEILKIRRLKGLDVSSNKIKLIPPGIGSLRQLVYFNASGNDLKTLPPQLGGLRKLQILNLSGNRIESLGFSLDALAGLKRLNLSGNCLEALPLGLNALNQLERIQLAYNDLCADDEAVWEEGDFSQIPGHQWHFPF